MSSDRKLKIGNCALCGEQKTLSNSHIVSEFLYKTMYEVNGPRKFFGLQVDSAESILTYQKGLREYLLCEDCETHLNNYETYAAGVFNGDNAGIPKIMGNVFTFSGLDYSKFKLFLLSILWRFSVTNLPAFAGMDLGPHQDKLRKMIKSNNPGYPWEYGCMVVAVAKDGKILSDIMYGPISSKVDGHLFWIVVVAGYVLHFYVNSHPPPDTLKSLILSDKGNFVILKKDITEIAFLYQDLLEIAEANKGRI